jgi:hypothetical protein
MRLHFTYLPQKVVQVLQAKLHIPVYSQVPRAVWNEIILTLSLDRVVQFATAVVYVLEHMFLQSLPTSHPCQLLGPQFVRRLVQGMSKHGLHSEVAPRSSPALLPLVTHRADPIIQLLRVVTRAQRRNRGLVRTVPRHPDLTEHFGSLGYSALRRESSFPKKLSSF